MNLKELHVMYVEESGDLRASSVDPETRHIMLKAVHHLETLSSYPVEKVKKHTHLVGVKFYVSLFYNIER